MNINIDKMVSNFLGWKLPADFYPDGGISLTGTYSHDDQYRPSGTNLFDAVQAKEMIEAMLVGAVEPIVSNVVNLPLEQGDLNADNTLENIKGQVTGFVLAGYDKDGECFFSSTYYDAKEGLWLVEQFKQSLIRNAGVE